MALAELITLISFLIAYIKPVVSRAGAVVRAQSEAGAGGVAGGQKGVAHKWAHTHTHICAHTEVKN